jgi:hypothetical protein
MTKPKEAIVLYDATTEQSIPLNVPKGGKAITVRHQLSPLPDERYFTFQEQIEETAGRTKQLSTDIYGPKERLWNDLAVAVEKYADKGDIKKSVHFTHKTEAVNAFLEVQMVDPEADDDDDVFDIDAHVSVPFRAMQGGVLFTEMRLHFRPESKAEMDAFLAVQENTPDPNKLASAQKRSKAEKLCELGRKLLQGQDGYKPGTPVPAYHLHPATEVFFLRQLAQAGKALA